MSVHIENTLKRRMKENGVTQKMLSQMTGLSQPYISQICSGQKAPTLDTLYALCKALSIDPTEWMENDASCVIPGLTGEEIGLLFTFRSLKPEDRGFVNRIANTLMTGASAAGGETG